VQARRDKAGLPPEHIGTPIPISNGILLATSEHFEWIDHGNTHEFRIPLSSSGASPSDDASCWPFVSPLENPFANLKLDPPRSHGSRISKPVPTTGS
jgi:hypothetical protein